MLTATPLSDVLTYYWLVPQDSRERGRTWLEAAAVPRARGRTHGPETSSWAGKDWQRLPADRGLVVRVAGGFELECAVGDVEVTAQAFLECVQHCRAAAVGQGR